MYYLTRQKRFHRAETKHVTVSKVHTCNGKQGNILKYTNVLSYGQVESNKQGNILKYTNVLSYGQVENNKQICKCLRPN